MMSKKVLLLICDGWGIGDRQKDDVIFNTPTPYWITCWRITRTHSCKLQVKT